jgi:hypothetical protein
LFQGCQSCNCDPVGSLNHTCDLYTGQCQCRPGVTGQRCDVCQPYQYGFSHAGCKPCECDQIGSLALQCDPLGQCPVSTVALLERAQAEVPTIQKTLYYSCEDKLVKVVCTHSMFWDIQNTYTGWFITKCLLITSSHVRLSFLPRNGI